MLSYILKKNNHANEDKFCGDGERMYICHIFAFLFYMCISTHVQGVQNISRVAMRIHKLQQFNN